MAVDYTTTALLEAVRRRCFAPAATATGTDTTSLLRALNENLYAHVVPMMRAAQEEFFVTYADTSLVSGTDAYAIPSRAVGGTVRDVWFVKNGGQRILPRVELPDVPKRGYDTTSTGEPSAFYLRGARVVVVPSTDGSGTLRMHYEARPGYLVETSAASLTGTLYSSTTMSTQSGVALFSTGQRLDIVSATPPFETLASDLTITSSATVLGAIVYTFSAGGVPSSVPTGSYLCLAGESPVPQVPVELHPLLTLRTAAQVLAAMGDAERLEGVKSDLRDTERAARDAISPRSPGRPRRLSGSPWD